MAGKKRVGVKVNPKNRAEHLHGSYNYHNKGIKHRRGRKSR